MKKKFIPNKILPKGARLIKPVRKKLGNWNELIYDAKVIRAGITWYRVKGGLGENHSREDWVANVPEICVSVHDYHWNGESFGANHGSFDKAVIAESANSLRLAKDRCIELQQKIARLKNGNQNS